MEITMELEEFLKSKGALVAFCKNVRKDRSLWTDNSKACINSFYWRDTKEGHDYWHDLYLRSETSIKPYSYYATHECLTPPPKSFKVI